jgi:hypothetical protein
MEFDADKHVEKLRAERLTRAREEKLQSGDAPRSFPPSQLSDGTCNCDPGLLLIGKVGMRA